MDKGQNVRQMVKTTAWILLMLAGTAQSQELDKTAAAADQRPWGERWATQNRSVSLSGLVLQQDYRELDSQGRTSDGTLNTERGRLTGGAVALRWQTGADVAVPLWLQARAEWTQGRTAYQGYLQRGTTLTPFAAKTGNVWQALELSVGLPLVLNQTGWQMTPFLQWSTSRWQRNLVQYSETYRANSVGSGVLLQWAVTDRLTLEGSLARLKNMPTRVSVPALGFTSRQESTTETTALELAVSYALAPHWHIHAGVQQKRWKAGASPIVAGLQVPGNLYKQTRYSVGLNYLFGDM